METEKIILHNNTTEKVIFSQESLARSLELVLLSTYKLVGIKYS